MKNLKTFIKLLAKLCLPGGLINKLPYLQLKEFILTHFYKHKFSYENEPYNRISFINYATQKFGFYNCKYLELGVLHEEVYKSICCDSQNKFGVDPVIGGNFRMTSNKFFKNVNNLIFDVIFIDADHTYKSLQEDIKNSLSVLNKNGIIFIHDLLPRNKLEASPKQTINLWHGETWKVAYELSRNPGLCLKIVNIDMGLGILKKNNFLSYTHLNKELQNKTYDDFINFYIQKLNIINCDEGFRFIKSDKN